jgi:hypothetical protein
MSTDPILRAALLRSTKIVYRGCDVERRDERWLVSVCGHLLFDASSREECMDRIDAHPPPRWWEDYEDIDAARRDADVMTRRTGARWIVSSAETGAWRISCT